MNNKISKITLDKINSYSERLGKPNDFLLGQYDELLDIEKKKRPKLNIERLEDRALIELRGFLRRKDQTLVRSTAVLFRGFIFGESGLLDIIEFMKIKGESMYTKGGKDRAYALKARLVNSEGIALDTREMSYEGGKQVPNPRYGYPFREDEHVYQRVLYGVAGLGENMKNIKLFQLRSKNEFAVNLEYPIWKWIDFRATIREKEDRYLLNMTSVTSFNQLLTEPGNMEDMLRKCGKKIWGIHEVEDAYAFYKGNEKGMRDNPLLFEADVQRIDAEPDRYNNRSFYLDSEELFESQNYGVRFQFPFPVPVENSQKVIVIGYPTKYRNRNDEEVTSLRGYGYYPLPEYLR